MHVYFRLDSLTAFHQLVGGNELAHLQSLGKIVLKPLQVREEIIVHHHHTHHRLQTLHRGCMDVWMIDRLREWFYVHMDYTVRIREIICPGLRMQYTPWFIHSNYLDWKIGSYVILGKLLHHKLFHQRKKHQRVDDTSNTSSKIASIILLRARSQHLLLVIISQVILVLTTHL